MKVTDVETGGFCQPMLRLICLLLPKVIICDSQILIVIVALCVKTCCSFSTEKPQRKWVSALDYTSFCWLSWTKRITVAAQCATNCWFLTSVSLASCYRHVSVSTVLLMLNLCHVVLLKNIYTLTKLLSSLSYDSVFCSGMGSNCGHKYSVLVNQDL